MTKRKLNQHPIRLVLTLAVVSALGLACAAVDNKAVAAQKAPSKATARDTNATVYYWYDGAKKRQIVIAADMVADFSSKSVIKDASQVSKSAASTSKTSQVFVDASSGTVARALPGGVLVRFEAVTSREQADAKLQRFGTRAVRAIGGSGKAWLVESEPGMASLTLANEIFESGIVETAAPNWYTQRATK